MLQGFQRRWSKLWQVVGLRKRDILVMNKSKIHTGGENTVLENWLWSRHRIFVMYLPPNTPKWTPVNAVWKEATREMKSIPQNPYQRHSVVRAAETVLDTFTRREMRDFYSDCWEECGL